LRDEIIQILIDGNWEKFQAPTYKGELLITGTTILLEVYLKDCKCSCGLGVGDRNVLRRRQQWKENFLGKTLIAIRHAFFCKEATRDLVKPTVEDVKNVWDWRQAMSTNNCQLCKASKDTAPLLYHALGDELPNTFYYAEKLV
jgi:hypothetical protein